MEHSGFSYAPEAKFKIEAIRLVREATSESYGDMTVRLLSLLNKYKFEGERSKELSTWMMSYMDGFLDGKEASSDGNKTESDVVHVS